MFLVSSFLGDFSWSHVFVVDLISWSWHERLWYSTWTCLWIAITNNEQSPFHHFLNRMRLIIIISMWTTVLCIIHFHSLFHFFNNVLYYYNTTTEIKPTMCNACPHCSLMKWRISLSCVSILAMIYDRSVIHFIPKSIYLTRIALKDLHQISQLELYKNIYLRSSFPSHCLQETEKNDCIFVL
jgi:hypothetical protein